MTTPQAPRTQLWREEFAILEELARAVPDGGTIVEIGTAEGGTSLLFDRACRGRGIRIFSVDIGAAPVAHAAVRDSAVTLVSAPSVDAAGRWRAIAGRPIDLLFIDGGHTLEHVIDDWNAWTGHVRPGGVVAVHDYDPVERGGVSHLAVRIGMEALQRAAALTGAVHAFKLFYGTIGTDGAKHIDAETCGAVFADIARQTTGVLEKDWNGATVVGDARTARLIDAVFGLSRPVQPVDAEAGARQSLSRLDSLTMCYVVAHGVKHHYWDVASLANPFGEFLGAVEALQMLDHGYGVSGFPYRIEHSADLSALSSQVAREQLRVTLLARALRTLVDWAP